MDRRTYLTLAGAAATGLLSGCRGGETDGLPTEQSPNDSEEIEGTTYGTLATSVTDQPTDIGDFESCVVTIRGLWVKPAESDDTATADTTETTTDPPEASTPGTDTSTAAAETPTAAEQDDGRRYIEFTEPQTADLVDLQGSNTQLLGETDVETGAYQFLQLDVGSVEGTLTDGSEASVETPGNAPLKFNTSFEVRETERTHFIADFTPVQRGNGSYLIRPVATGTTVLYGDELYGATDTTETETETTAETPTPTATNTGPDSGPGPGNSADRNGGTRSN